MEREALRLQQEIELFSLPVEMYAGGREQPSRRGLVDTLRNMLGMEGPTEDELEKQFEREAVRAAEKAMDQGDDQMASYILDRYHAQAQERAKERGVKLGGKDNWQGNRALLQLTASAGYIRI